jgi:hypothetical protein
MAKAARKQGQQEDLLQLRLASTRAWILTRWEAPGRRRQEARRGQEEALEAQSRCSTPNCAKKNLCCALVGQPLKPRAPAAAAPMMPSPLGQPCRPPAFQRRRVPDCFGRRGQVGGEPYADRSRSPEGVVCVAEGRVARCGGSERVEGAPAGWAGMGEVTHVLGASSLRLWRACVRLLTKSIGAQVPRRSARLPDQLDLGCVGPLWDHGMPSCV